MSRPLIPLLALISLLAASCGNTPEPPRGVLLISIDSLRADHLSSFGYRSATRPEIPTTPNIDKLLSKAGVRFANTISTTSWTLPSHLAMLSGRPDELHGVRALPERLPNSVPLIQESFLAAGWRTAGFWSGPNLHPWFGFDRGFEEYVDCSARPVRDPEVFALNDAEKDRGAVMAAHDDSHSGITGPKVVDAFDTWFDSVNPDEPFFAFVHLWDVHYDYEPPAEYDVFDPGYTGKVDGLDFMKLRIAPGATRDMNHLKALYDGEIRFTDHNIERLLARLDQDERFDNTLVILTADHGEAFGEHGLLGHKQSLFIEEVHVPLIMRFPDRIPAGHVVPEMVSLVDIAPTILEFADLPGLDGQWGRSLAGLATGEVKNLPERPMPLELSAPYLDRKLREARWQDATVLNRVSDMTGNVGMRVFDLKRDPKEHRPIDLSKQPPLFSRVAQARALWAELDAGIPAQDSTNALPEDLEQDLSDAGYTSGNSQDD